MLQSPSIRRESSHAPFPARAQAAEGEGGALLFLTISLSKAQSGQRTHQEWRIEGKAELCAYSCWPLARVKLCSLQWHLEGEGICPVAHETLVALKKQSQTHLGFRQHIWRKSLHQTSTAIPWIHILVWEGKATFVVYSVPKKRASPKRNQRGELHPEFAL